MSIVRTYMVVCDGFGCQEEFDSGAESLAEARKWTQTIGWTLKADGSSYCEFCTQVENVIEQAKLNGANPVTSLCKWAKEQTPKLITHYIVTRYKSTVVYSLPENATRLTCKEVETGERKGYCYGTEGLRSFLNARRYGRSLDQWNQSRRGIGAHQP